MELFETTTHYIIQDGENSLWCSRENGFMEARSAFDICMVQEPFCLGLVHNVIGRLQIGNDPDYNLLMLVTKQTSVGILPGDHPIFRIDSVFFLPLTSSLNYYNAAYQQESSGQQVSDQQLCREWIVANLQKCPKHNAQSASMKFDSNSPNNFVKRTFSNFLSPTGDNNSNLIFRKSTNKAAKQICESLDKLFNDSPSFYYSPSADITASTWRISANANIRKNTLIADDRFFWNRSMLEDLLNNQNPLSSFWIVPIIQGFVQFDHVTIPIPASSESSPDAVVYLTESGDVYTMPPVIDLHVGLISRRSRYMAGTRYKKRGTDEVGHCANYVETEQILFWPPHWCSYVIVRGSVPLFWSQSGIQYHPPPKLEKSFNENATAFSLHFEREVAHYKAVNVVNLLHQSSKEVSLSSAYTENVLYYNSPLLTYISFDFNEHCRGMKFENVMILTQNTDDLIRDSLFTWIDASGIVCEQGSVFRVNCLDCLDRTNVVQAAICRVVLELQCGKMGILPPDCILPNDVLKCFKALWANNGDAISKQYAGTNALKGEFTRTGEHGLTGLLKDGVNSANRYYLNQFQDSDRQVAIDICHGIQPSGISQSSSGHNLVLAGEETAGVTSSAETIEAKCENLLAIMEDVRKMLLTDEDLCLGSWLLFDSSSDTSATADTDFDVIMVLSMNSVFIVRLDVEGDLVFYYDIPLYLIEKIECGQLSLSGGGVLNFAKKAKKVGGIKITYRQMDDQQVLESFSFILRPANFRLFSGVLIPVENDSDAQEVLTMICECFRNVDRISNSTFPVEELGENAMLKIDRKKTPRIDSHPNRLMWTARMESTLSMQSPPKRPDVSTVVNAPKKLFVNTFKQFSNLLKPTQREGGAASPSPGLASEKSVVGENSSTFQQFNYQQEPNSSMQASPFDRKREILKQMPVCRTRVVQL